MADKSSNSTNAICLIAAVLGVIFILSGDFIIGAVLIIGAAVYWYSGRSKQEQPMQGGQPDQKKPEEPKALHDTELEGVRRVKLMIKNRTRKESFANWWDVDAPETVLARPEVARYCVAPGTPGAHYCYRFFLNGSILTHEQFEVNESTVQFYDDSNRPIDMGRIRWAFQYFPEDGFAFLYVWPKH